MDLKKCRIFPKRHEFNSVIFPVRQHLRFALFRSRKLDLKPLQLPQLRKCRRDNHESQRQTKKPKSTVKHHVDDP